MRKRERENPCEVCGHFHKFGEGEVCGVCGHKMLASTSMATTTHHHESAFPSEILKGFLYLGSYDNASRREHLKVLGVSHILNTIPACQNLYSTNLTYHRIKDDKCLHLGEAIQFIEKCEKERAPVLVHCMTGKSRSAAIVIAYLMKCKRWPLAQSLRWVKERRPQVELLPGVQQQLLEFEQKFFGSSVNYDSNGNSLLPLSDQLGTMSLLESGPKITPYNPFSGAERTEGQKNSENNPFGDFMGGLR